MKRLAIAVLILLLTAGVSFATTAQQVDFLLSGSLNGDGSVNSGGKVYTCDAGTVCGSSTSNPKTTWQDANKVTPHANPIILDAFGRASVFADGNYKFQIDGSDDVLIETIDNIFYDVTSGTTLMAQDTLTPSSQTIDTTVDTYYCDAVSGDVITDFSGVSAVGNTGRRYTFKKIDSTLNTCTIDVLSSQTIDGALTAVLRNQYDDITIESDGSNWTEVRGMLFSRAATFHNTVTVYNAATFNAATFNATTTFNDSSTFNNATTFSDVATFNNTVSWSKGADIASSNTITPLADGNYFDVTGTTDIFAINTVGVGTTVKFHFDSAVTLIHNATDLALPGLANITTGSGDEYEFTEYASGDWRVTGRVINSPSPSFSVHKNGSAQSSVGTSFEIITWSTEVFDTNSNFNNTVECGSTCNRFTPTVAGKYLLTAQLQFSVDADLDLLAVSIFKNGVQNRTSNLYASTANAQTTGITHIFNANGTTDYFEVYGANGTTADTVEGLVLGTYFSGSRIGQ